MRVEKVNENMINLTGADLSCAERVPTQSKMNFSNSIEEA